jgi:DNA helicase-2/ATP-dependent DNA helicase PcrA
MENRPDFNQAYKEAINKLNPAQKEAVEAIEGPVMVIAGPGTGKTQILAARIGMILQKTDCNPSNILCLTYTDAGVVAMRKRLTDFIGPDAHKVGIYTFHSFCNEVIQENSSMMGIGELSVMNDLDSVQVFEELLAELPNSHPLKNLKGFYSYNGHLKHLFGIMRDENWTVEFIKTKSEEYLESLKEDEKFYYKTSSKKFGYEKGDLKQSSFDDECSKIDKLLKGALLLDRYQEIKKKRKLYDFQDMIQWVMKSFQTNGELLADYQEKFQYILVDEYQDSNGSQNEIIQLLISFWEVPNVFVVGDDDQSIYRFQGANIQNIVEFAKNQGDFLKTVVLKENYRSGQSILNLSDQLVSNNNERLLNDPLFSTLSKKLEAKGVNAPKAAKPRLVQLQDEFHETAWLGEELKRRYEEKGDISNVAVIYRNHKHVDDLCKVLTKNNIPFNIKRRENILQAPLIRNILTIFKFLNEEFTDPEATDGLLFEILHFQCHNISHSDVLWLVQMANGKSRKTSETLKNTFFNEDMLNRSDVFKNESPGMTDLRKWSKLLQKWTKYVTDNTVEQLLEAIITESNMLSILMSLGGEQRNQELEQLKTFFDFIKVEANKTEHLSLKTFLENIDLLNAEGLPIPSQQVFYNTKGVSLMTAHGSKGLEFDVVYIIKCVDKAWEKSGSSNYSFTFPDNLYPKLEKHVELEDERRLFYVAMTRAKQELIFSYPEMIGGKNSTPSVFVSEIKSEDNLVIEEVSVDDAVLFRSALDFLISLKEPVTYPLIDTNKVDKFLSTHRVSISQLNSYLRCQLAFYFDNILRIPGGRKSFMGFGSAIHESLQVYFEEMKSSEDKTFPSEDRLEALVAGFMKKHKSAFTEKEFEKFKAYGMDVVKGYIKEFKDVFETKVDLELRVNGAEIAGIPVSGVIDKIEYLANGVNLIDYKTGKYDKSKISPPTDKTMGGDYWRQGMFYKLMLQGYQGKTWNINRVQFDFVEAQGDNKPKSVAVDISHGEEVLIQQMQMFKQGLENYQFEGCKKNRCDWCNFVDQNFRGENVPALEEV